MAQINADIIIGGNRENIGFGEMATGLQDAGYTFGGEITPTSTPSPTEQSLFFVAMTAGTYTNYGGIVVAAGEIAFIYKENGSWVKVSKTFATPEQGELADSAYQKPDGGIPSTDMTASVQTSLGKADTAIQSVAVGTTTTGEEGTDASVINSGTPTNPVFDFTIPRGDSAVNPFKGWFEAGTTETSNLPANPSVGDYAYVQTVDGEDDPITKVYDCVAAGVWHDSGRTIDTSNVQTFETLQQVNEVSIIDNLTTGGSNDALSAEQGKVLKQELTQLDQDLNGKLDKTHVQENGEFHIDNFGNIGYKYDENGLDFAKLSEHAVELIKSLIGGGGGGGDGQNVRIVEEDGFFIVDNNGYIGLKYDENGLDSAIISNHFKNNFGVDFSSLEKLLAKQKIVGTEYNRKILLLGDSLTQGQGTGRVYGNYLAALLPSYTIINKGEGGANIQDLMARTNVFPAVATSALTIPASGQVTIGNLNSSYDNRALNLMTQNPNVCNPIMFHGVSGNLSRNSNGYIFTRETSGSTTISVEANSLLFCYEGSELMNSEICVLWIGQNGVFTTVDDYVQKIKYFVNALRTEHYVVIAPTNRSYGTVCNYEYDEMLEKMTSAFGNNYLDLLGYLCTDALSDAGITPTAADIAAMADYKVPPSLLGDSVHFNAIGYELIANKIYKKFITQKYI